MVYLSRDYRNEFVSEICAEFVVQAQLDDASIDTDIRVSIQRLSRRRQIELPERDIESIAGEVLVKLRSYFSDERNVVRKKKCWCFQACITCNKRNFYSRLKLTGSTFLSYLDMISDTVVFLAILSLVGNIESRKHWIYWSVVYIISPSLLHVYYLTYCEGWRDRTFSVKVKDALINLLFLRPAVELVKSCKASNEIEACDTNDEMLHLSMNGKYFALMFELT